MPQFLDRKTFTVPVTNGQYAPEVIDLSSGLSGVISPGLLGATILIESLPATAAVELWLLRVGGDASNQAHFFPSGKGLTAVGADTWPLAGWRGAQVRVKSGGTAGSAIVNATAD